MEKKIHYCWFGGKKLPKEVEQCIATWKKFLPDYEIKEWNESNFDINTCTFVKEAYENKKWAFVSDYVRIYALYQEGGIYFDTDMKIIKDVSNIVDKEMFLGYEDSGYVGTAVIGTREKNNKYIKEILDYYNKIDHFDADIIYNYANPVIITRILKKYDSRTDENGIKIFDNNVYIYPRDYFYPLSYNYAERVYTENTCMVHLFSATWTDKGERRTIRIYRKLGPDVGKVLNRIIDGLFSLKGKTINGLKKIYNFARMQYSIYVNREKRVNRIKEELANKKAKYIVVCHPEMTEKSDVQILFKENILDIREQYTKKEACQIARAIIDSGKELVIFNSYADGWNRIISELKNIKRNISIKVLIHNGNELLADSVTWNNFNTIIDLYDKGKIDELTFFKEDVYKFYKEKGYRTSFIRKCVNIENVEQYKKEEKKDYIKIGLYEAYDNRERNVYNQLSAISLLENARLDCAPTNYKISMMARKYNINLSSSNGNLSKQELYTKMANNDINLYVTLIDNTSILPLESLELGTICLVSQNCNYFAGSELEKYLVVEKPNDIMEIYNKIKFSLKNKEKILELYNNWKNDYIVEVKEILDKYTIVK